MEIETLESQLENSPPPQPELAELFRGDATLSEVESQWMEFEFDSYESTKTVDQKSESYQFAMAFEADFGLVEVSGQTIKVQTYNIGNGYDISKPHLLTVCGW